MLKKIEIIAQGVCEREGCRLYDVEWVSGSKGMGRALRVYVDGANGPASLEDCEKVSRGLSLMLDVDDAIPGGEYALEVSTPGIERTLRRQDHFQGVIGKSIFLKALEDLNVLNPGIAKTPGVKRMKAKGEVISCDDQVLIMKVDNQEFRVPLSIVEKAHVVWDFEADKGQKK